MSRAEHMLSELRRAGLKLTPQRTAIVHAIADDCTHPTAQDLFERMRKEFPSMSFATVYNTLDALAEHGLTGSLRLGNAVRFDPNVEPHHHAVCDRCGAVEDLAAGAPSKKTIDELSRGGFQVRAEERTYRGLCQRCAGH